MESIALGFMDLMGFWPYWIVLAFAIVLGVLEVLLADKCGVRSFCYLTFNYYSPKMLTDVNSDPSMVKLQMLMVRLCLVAMVLPLIFWKVAEYNLFFVIFWWLLFYVTAMIAQWVVLLIEGVGLWFNRRFFI